MSRFPFAFFCGLFFASALTAYGQGTKLWNQSHYEEWEKGQPEGVALRSDGSLEPGPTLKLLAKTPSSYVWAVAPDGQGGVYAGTGSPATVLHITADGKTTTLLKSKDLSVQTVRVGPDGAVYAATLPGGKVYRLDPKRLDLDAENATAVFDPAKVENAPKYIWDLRFDSQGRLYIATGGPAAVYRVATPAQPGGSPELFFKSDEEHIRCLLFERDGSLVAGSDGDGLIYRIGRDGRGVVLYSAPKREITALSESPNGELYLAAVGEKGKSSLPPLPVQGAPNITATITILTPGSVQASNANTLIPDGSEVYELNREGAPRRLWAAHDDVVYALEWTPEGLLAATGNRGRVYRVSEDGQYADVGHLQAAQGTAFAPAPGGFFVGTSNSGKVFTLGARPAPESTYVSDSFDAGVFSRWGRAEVDGSQYELYARSGNVQNPERNWSAWERVDPNAATVGAPSSRYLQWKAVLRPGARLNAVGINYLPVNVAPAVDEIIVQTGARVTSPPAPPPSQQPIMINLPSVTANSVNIVQDQNTGPLQATRDKNAVTVRWAAHDDNGDDLVFGVYYRGAGERNWQLLKDNVTDRYLSFDATQLPNGPYRLKVVASDAPSHNPGEALTGSRESERFTIDTAPPAVEPMTARLENGRIHVTATAKDPSSPITHAEFSVDAGPWQYIEPVGKLSDALTEHYDFIAPLRPAPETGAMDKLPPGDPNEHVVTLRVYDRFENSAAAKTVVR